MVEHELLGARVELDPAGAGVEAALRLGERVVVWIHAAERDEQPVAPAAAAITMSLARG